MLGALQKLFAPKPPAEVEATYIALLRASRNPFFFEALGVPDTIDGRFELIVLHLFLLQNRLLMQGGLAPLATSSLTPAASGSRHKALRVPETSRSRDGRGEPERRERGDSKRSVERRSQPVAGAIRPPREALETFSQFLSEAFFNDMDASLRELGVADTGVSKRIKKMGKAYHGCLQAYAASMNDPTTLRAALARNVYGTVVNGDVAVLNRLGNYVEQMVKSLAEITPETITSANYHWPDVATFGL